MPDSPRRQDTVAVALRQDGGDSAAPARVVAHGRGRVAEQILEIAVAQGVKVRADADLVEMLAALDIDSPIPVEAFAAVAEILVHLHEANRRATATALAGEAAS